ncbi:hypothetical protein Tco_1355066 [Tanacetum coccineum]
MQSFADRFLRRNVPPFRSNRPSSNYGRDRKEQNGANGVFNSKMSFVVQRHNRKEWNEKPRSVEKLCGNANNWKGCKEGTIRKVQHPKWVANTISVKLANGTWKVQVDYSTLNKVYAKDMYPFSEKGEELASLMEYPHKCFQRLPKENSQIRMAENDEEKTGFHTEKGVYCFTHMPKGLKNSAKTLQRMMEKVLANQKGRNVEVYLEEIVVKSKSEQSLVQDVEETLRKLKRVNIKIDPNTSSFGVEEGRFLRHVVMKEGIRADPEKFIPKLAELKYPINKVRMRLDVATESGWTNEAEEALQRIKGKLKNLQTLPIPKEGEELMLCMRQRNETISSVLMVEREGVQALVSYEAEGSVVKKFFGQGEQVQKTPNANEGETSNLSKKLQAKLTQHQWPGGYTWAKKQSKKVQVLDHASSKNLKLQNRSVNGVGNHKAGIPQPRSFDGNQDKTIGLSGKSSTQGTSEKV